MNYRVCRRTDETGAVEVVAEFAERGLAQRFLDMLGELPASGTYIMEAPASQAEPSQKENLIKRFHHRLAQYERSLNALGFGINKSRVAEEACTLFDVDMSPMLVSRMFKEDDETAPGIDKVMAVFSVLDIPIGAIASVRRPDNQQARLSDALRPVRLSKDPSVYSSSPSALHDESLAGTYEVFYFRPKPALTPGELMGQSELEAAQVIRGRLEIDANGNTLLEELAPRGEGTAPRRFTGMAIDMTKGAAVVINLRGESEETDFMILCFKHTRLTGGGLLFSLAAMTTSGGSEADHVPVQQLAGIFRLPAANAQVMTDEQVNELVRPLISLGTRKITVPYGKLDELRERFPELASCFDTIASTAVAVIDPMDIFDANCTADNHERTRAMLYALHLDEGRRTNIAANPIGETAGFMRHVVRKAFK